MKATRLLPLAALLFGAASFTTLRAEPAKDAKPAAPAAAAALTDPSKFNEKAPDGFKVKFTTTKGDVIIQISRDLSPNGADRFYNLVKGGFFTEIAFFRVIPGFMGQFGIHGDPAVAAAWKVAKIEDDKVKGSNIRGAITFAMAGPNTRTTQFFINLANNPNLDSSGFSPFGKVIEGMDVINKINGEYGEGAPNGSGPEQGRVQAEGNAYLQKDFPRLDYIKSASVLPADK